MYLFAYMRCLSWLHVHSVNFVQTSSNDLYWFIRILTTNIHCTFIDITNKRLQNTTPGIHKMIYVGLCRNFVGSMPNPYYILICKWLRNRQIESWYGFNKWFLAIMVNTTISKSITLCAREKAINFAIPTYHVHEKFLS